MKLSSRTLILLAAFVTAVAALPILFEQDLKAEPPQDGTVAAPIADEPISRRREALLDLAFAAASAMPLDPHVKNRSRAQAEVVSTALAMGRYEQARGMIPGIALPWRRGAAWAELALAAARGGRKATARAALAEADRVVAALEHADAEQTWRRDRIRAHAALALLELDGEAPLAAGEAAIVASEAGALDAERAVRSKPDDFDHLLAVIDGEFERGGFDGARIALQTCVALYRTNLADAGRRAALTRRVRTSFAGLPVDLRITHLVEMAEIAVAGGERADALALVKEARAHLDAVRWLTQDFVPLSARIAAARHAAGDAEGARRELTATMGRYERDREAIVDMFRAAALRPLAAAYHRVGDEKAALATWRLALNEGRRNPNGRPRAVDLAATAASIAASGVEPDQELVAELERLRGELGAPW